SEPEATAEVIAELSADQPKPVMASYMGAASIGPALRLLNEYRIPNYSFPERAVAALRAMYSQYVWSERPESDYAHFDVDTDRVREVFDKVRSSGRVALSEIEARDVI